MNIVRTTLQSICAALLFCAFASPFGAQAFPKRSVILQGAQELASTEAGSAVFTTSRSIHPVSLKFTLPDETVVRLRLTTERRFKGLERSHIKRILQGFATFVGDRRVASSHSSVAAVSVVLSQDTDGAVNVHGVVETIGTRRLSKQSSLLILSGRVAAKGVTRVLLRDGGKWTVPSCGTFASAGANRSGFQTRGDVTTQGFRQLEILLEGDSEFFSIAGAEALTELSQVLSLTDVIYRRDLNLTIQPTIIDSAATFSSVFRYGDDFVLDFFHEMRAKRPNFSQDVYAVITGKTPPDASLTNTAGIANNIGSTCRTPSESQTVVRRFREFSGGTFYTFAHEVGHLLGGEHDDSLSGDSTTGYIMNSGTSTVREYLERFSQYSITQIGSYVLANGSCLIDVGDAPPAIAPPATDTPTPAPDSLSLEAEVERIGGRDVVYFYAYDGEEPINRASIDVYRNGRTPKFVKTIRSRSDGSAAYKRAARGKYYGALSSSPTVTSNTVTVRR